MFLTDQPNNREIAMEYYVQVVTIGIVNGSIYALIGLGLALIFGVMRIVNVAHGELVTVGAYTSLFLGTALSPNPLVTIVPTILVGFFLGLAIDKGLFLQLRRGGEWETSSTMVLALGISTTLANLMLIIWGANYLEGIALIKGTVPLFGMQFSGQRLLTAGICIILVIALFAFLKWTKTGRAIRAISQNPVAAQALGVDQNQIYGITFGVSTALAAAAGSLVASIFYIYPYLGLPYLMKAFIITVLGGLGSLPGALLASFVLGIAESVGVAVIGAEYKGIIGLALMVVVLVFRPSGLLGKKMREA